MPYAYSSPIIGHQVLQGAALSDHAPRGGDNRYQQQHRALGSSSLGDQPVWWGGTGWVENNGGWCYQPEFPAPMKAQLRGEV